MRVLWLLAAWSVLAVLATMCFALGGSIGYRRGVRDAVAQLKDRRSGKTGCRPLPANHLRRRTSGYSRPGARARRARWPAARRSAGPVRSTTRSRLTTAAAASAAAILLIGVPGTAIGATTARPGEPLWKVKLGLERVRVAVAAGPERNAEVHVDLASARLSELAGLVGSDILPDVVGDVSDDLGVHTEAANEALGAVAPSPDRDELRRRLTDLTDRRELVMDTLGVACADSDADCVALSEPSDETAEPAETTDEPVALAVPVEPPTEAASAPPVSVAQADAAATAPADGDGTSPDTTTQDATAAEASPPQSSEAAAASEPPAVTASPVPSTSEEPASESPSESPSPTPSPSPSGSEGPVAGSPATEVPSTLSAPANVAPREALEARASQQ